MFTSSYATPGMLDLLTLIVRITNSRSIVEIGTQQGTSAVALARGLPKYGMLQTWDTYEETYTVEPRKPTHANYEMACNALYPDGFVSSNGYADLHTGNEDDALEWMRESNMTTVDLLHVDICNHKKNVMPVLEKFAKCITKCIILEGGVHNHWQKQYGFEQYRDCLDSWEWRGVWTPATVAFSENNAITVLTRTNV